MIQQNRRNFLKGLGILGAAPAIVKAENIMKIWTPPSFKERFLQTIPSAHLKSGAASPGYYTLSCWMKDDTTDWGIHQEIVHIKPGQTEIAFNFPRQFSRAPKISFTGVQLQRIS